MAIKTSYSPFTKLIVESYDSLCFTEEIQIMHQLATPRSRVRAPYRASHKFAHSNNKIKIFIALRRVGKIINLSIIFLPIVISDRIFFILLSINKKISILKRQQDSTSWQKIEIV